MDGVADTTLLIGLWRSQPWALRFVSENRDYVVGIPWTVQGEFLHGAVRAEHDLDRVEAFLHRGITLSPGRQTMMAYAHTAAALQEVGIYREIGQNDIWIAASAIAHGKPLITRNRRHFDQMPGLELIVLDED